MKVTGAYLFLFFLLVSVMPLPALTFSYTSGGAVSAEGENALLSFSSETFLIRTDLVSFGSMAGGGILAAIDDPFSSYSITPYFSSLRFSSGMSAAAFSPGNFTFFSFSGKRNGAGASWKGKNMTASLLFASSADDSDVQKEPLLRLNRSVIWGAVEYKGNSLFSFRLLSSLTEWHSLSLSLRTAIHIRPFSVSFGHGRVQAFAKEGNPWCTFFSVTLDENGFCITHTLKMGREGLYVGEYRDYEYLIEAKLKAGSITFFDKVKKSFTAGKTGRRETIGISWRDFTLSWTENDGFSLALRKDGVSVSMDEGGLDVVLSGTLDSGSVSLSFSLDESRFSRWKISWTYDQDRR